MKKEEFRGRLNAEVPAMPRHFTQNMQQTLDHIRTQAPASRRSRRIFGITRRAALALLIAVSLIGAAALASTLLRQNVFEVILGNSPENAAGIMQYDLARESFGEYDVEIRQAAYDGVSLYVVYSIRDRGAAEPLGMLDTEPDVYYITREALEAMEEREVGWWGSTFWMNGVPVPIPSLSWEAVRGSTEPGEMLFYEMYRLDQADVLPEGQAVEITLPIGRKPSPDTLRFREDNQITARPDEGIVSFTLDCSIRSGVTVTNPNIAIALPFGTAQVLEAVYTPIQLYVTLGYTVTPEALDAFKEKHGEGYEDENGKLIVDEHGNARIPFMENDIVEDWVANLWLVDGDGNMLYNAPRYMDDYGLLGYWNAQAWFTFPYLETYPEELYLAPICGSDADMALAVCVK